MISLCMLLPCSHGAPLIEVSRTLHVQHLPWQPGEYLCHWL